MFIAPLLLSLSVLLPAQSAHESCEDIRTVKALAASEGWAPGPTLQALEQRYCTPPEATRDDCWDLWVMTELAYLGGKTDMGRLVDDVRSATCAVGGLGRTTRYGNGVLIRSASGALNYPNGTRARSSSGAWSYPNGVRARSARHRWSYPSGVRARDEKGRWSAPNGRTFNSATEMLLHVCSTRGGCGRELEEISEWEGEARTVGILRVAWLASRKKPGR